VGAPVRLTDENRPWWTLAGACGGLFLLMLDSTVVTLALPDIEHDVGASAAEVQWVVNAYLLVMAALVVTAGRFGDIFGRRRVYLIGLALFGVGSVVAATAATPEVLIAGRVIQGAGGAPVIGLSLAIVTAVFAPERQAAAVGIWTAVSSIALGIGPLIGGALVEFDWRLIFWVNIPLIAAGLAITILATPETRDETAEPRIDWGGLITLGMGLGAVIFAFVESDRWGFGDARFLGLLAGGVVLLACFVVIERHARQPIVDLTLFRNGPYFGATAAAFALVGGYWSVIFFQPQYMQGVLGYSAITAGVLILPLTLPMIVVSPFAGRLIARFGARGLMGTGMLLAVAGLVVQTRLTADSGYGELFVGLLLFGIALGCVYAPMSSAAMAAMPASKAGIAAGVLAMNRLLSGAVSLAVTGAIFQALQGDQIEDAGATKNEAFAYALSHSFWFLVGLMAIGTALTWIFVRGPDDPGPDPAVAGDPDPADLQHHTHHRRFHL
jgi:EmrB/QacA subfamily drug resistance transporter